MRKYRLPLFVTFLLAICGVWFVHRQGAVNARDQTSPPPVPVTAAPAKVQDVPVDLRGLGTMQAFNTVFNTVQVKPQVNDAPRMPHNCKVHRDG